MNSERCGRFILLDLCHPMSPDTVKTVIGSLENALVLGLSFPLNGLQFGIFVLNSDFKLIQPSSDFRQNYSTISKALRGLLKITEENTKVTIQKYKELTSQSLRTIFREFLPRLETRKQLEGVSIQIAIVTKKTASVLVEILMDVLKKLQDTSSKDVWKKFKIVQILNENEEMYKMLQKNELIECATCLSHPHYLTCFFKDWLLNPEEYLEILIKENPNFTLKCDVDNFIIKPVSSLINPKINANIFDRIPSLDNLKPNNLEVISKIPINRFCPTLVFGIPRRITPTLSKSLTWTEFQVNRQLFKGLCLELQNATQGLLTRTKIQTDGREIFTFQFITSDGDILLMNDVAPEELYLPKSVKSLKADNVAEDVTAIVKICLENIKLLDQYCPRDFASGIYEYLTNYLIQASHGKIPSKRFSSKHGRRFLPVDENFVIKNNKIDTQNTTTETSQSKKKQKFNPEVEVKEMKNVHPALLPQETVQKYRKINSKVFNLPELSQDFSQDLPQWN